MPVELNGSCHCGAVKYSVLSSTPVPYQLCLCSICRKVGGSGGSTNLGGHYESLKVEGKENISVYRAVLDRGTSQERRVSSERNFCKRCGSMLWLYDKQWFWARILFIRSLFSLHHRPELIHPFASSVDSPELVPPQTMVCVKLSSKPGYVRLPEGDKQIYQDYGPDSLEDWHKKNGLYQG